MADTVLVSGGSGYIDSIVDTARSLIDLGIVKA